MCDLIVSAIGMDITNDPRLSFVSAKESLVMVTKITLNIVPHVLLLLSYHDVLDP